MPFEIEVHVLAMRRCSAGQVLQIGDDLIGDVASHRVLHGVLMEPRVVVPGVENQRIETRLWRSSPSAVPENRWRRSLSARKAT